MWEKPSNRKCGTEMFFWPWPGLPVGAVVLLAVSFLYVWLRVEPRLEYHSFGPFFYRNWGFLETFLDRPGGWANYAGIFLAQFNGLNGVGALVFVGCQSVVLLLTLLCLTRVSGRAPGFAALVPLFVFLLLRNRFGCPVAALSVGLLLALAASAAYVWLPWRRHWLAMVVSGLISSVLFYLAGFWSALVFAVLCCLWAIIQMRHLIAGLGCLVLALVAPVVAIALGNIDNAGLVNPWPKGAHGILATVLYGSVPITAVILALLPKPVATTTPSQLDPRLRSSHFPHAGVLLLCLLGWAVVWLTFDPHQKLLAQIDYDASCERYEAVLATARQVKTLNHSAMIRLHLALYHTGRLAEELFVYQNMIEQAPFEGIGEACRAQSQSLFELGLVNDAEHMAYEALQMEGDRPDLLRLLARINLLKGQPQAAQVFLNVLSLIPFQGERANETWPQMNLPARASESASASGMPTRVLTNDVLHDGLPVGRLLGVLLTSDPTNQMAFEYLMADYLMDLDLKQAVGHLRFLDNFHYARIPRPYEEALLLFQELTGTVVDLKGRVVRPETLEHFRQFKAAVSQMDGRAEDQATLAVNFGDTYWLFYAARSRERAADGQATPP
jgi:hypothetical protein